MKKLILMLLMMVNYFGATAQIPQPDPDTTAKHFLTVASIGNLQEANAGQLAVQKAKRADVKAFAQVMIKDHSDAEQKLMQLAKQQHIDLSPSATSNIQPDLNLKKAGNDFDKLYVHAMVSGHRGTVQSFETYATTGKNPAVKAFAQQMLPALKMHFEHIKTIEEHLNTKQ